MAQTGGPSVVVVSIKHDGEHPQLGHLLINRDGKNERRNLTNPFFMSPLTVDQTMTARANVLRQIVTQLYQEGYVLKASLGHTEVDELIFIKEK
jgi:hypothetical protein